MVFSWFPVAFKHWQCWWPCQSWYRCLWGKPLRLDTHCGHGAGSGCCSLGRSRWLEFQPVRMVILTLQQGRSYLTQVSGVCASREYLWLHLNSEVWSVRWKYLRYKLDRHYSEYFVIMCSCYGAVAVPSYIIPCTGLMCFSQTASGFCESH